MMWNMFKFNNKDFRATSLTYFVLGWLFLTLNIFYTFSLVVSKVDFEQVFVCCVGVEADIYGVK